ncbi:hypothetical protein O204_15590 [Pseudomonas simiae]|uniref:Uncharacterized protein n=1 Tax=Pseudomonas simiae TaxID=321846 RepID=U1TAB5_9PSED|nr:hypothetical protein O204_15590 [Pseudomonas simiae]
MVAMEKRLERTCDGAMAEGIGILENTRVGSLSEMGRTGLGVDPAARDLKF